MNSTEHLNLNKQPSDNIMTIATLNNMMKQSAFSKQTVPTKTCDGGSSKVTRKVLSLREKRLDPFLFYSSQDDRLNVLHGWQEESNSSSARDDADSKNTEKKHQPEKAGEQAENRDKTFILRKTRISFEVHPSLVMMLMIDELENGMLH